MCMQSFCSYEYDLVLMDFLSLVLSAVVEEYIQVLTDLFTPRQ